MASITFPSGQEISIQDGLVLVGANGSGKSRLGSWLEDNISGRPVLRISAQKSLIFPDNASPRDAKLSENMLLYGIDELTEGNEANMRRMYRYGQKPVINQVNDYEQLVTYLLSEDYKIMSEHRNSARISGASHTAPPPKTRLDIVKEIWEAVLPHRQLIPEGSSIKAIARQQGNKYNASEMSDGERIIFYLIGQCLSAKQDSIIIVDEPELHLHKAIQYSLWNAIEGYRSDCTFIYLTHDIEFAVSRPSSQKIWVKSFDGTNWDFQLVMDIENVPEGLVLELLGSRKSILLVEGTASSLDVSLYQVVFPQMLVRPCGSCKNVIDFTKVLRANSTMHHLDIIGLIDRDRRTNAEITALKHDNVFTLEVAEVENIFIVEEMLTIIANTLQQDIVTKLHEASKQAFNCLHAELEKQKTERTVQEIKQILAGVDIKSGNRETVIANFNAYVKSLNVASLYNKNSELYDEIIAGQNYKKLLAFYNRKSLPKQLSGIFGLKPGEIENLLLRKARKGDPEITRAVCSYLPNELVPKLQI